MKRTALALVIPALLAMGTAHAAEVYNKNGNKLDLYGKVDGLHYFSDDTSSDGDMSYARLGFKGETQINTELTGYGQWEYNFQANATESSTGTQGWTRLAFAGLKFGELGSFDYGRNYGVVYDAEGYTDMLPEFGGDTSAQTDVYMTNRATGLATYRNTDFFGFVTGLNFALQYQGNNESASTEQEGSSGDHTKTSKQNGDGWGMSTSYDTGMGISASAAYSSSDRTDDQAVAGHSLYNEKAGGDKADAWAVGLKYDANNIYLATMYSETTNMTAYGDSGIANKTQNFEVVAQYQFDFGLRPSIAYLQSKGKDLNSAYGHDQDLVKYVDVGTTYYFNKNMSTYVDYKINLLDSDDDFNTANNISTDDIVAIGLVYQF